MESVRDGPPRRRPHAGDDPAPSGRRVAGRRVRLPPGLAGVFCSHLVRVGLAHLGVDAPPAAALAAETTPAGDLRSWLATLSQGELTELVIEAADEDRDYRRRLGLRSRTQASQQ